MSGSAPTPPSLGLRTSDDRGGTWHGEFFRPPLSVFLPSRAYSLLTEEIRRYLTEEVNGRSFLISAHRGVGKTALVLRAVEDVKWAVIAEERRTAHQFRDPGSRPTGAQRPFLVKLNGSALLSNDRPVGTVDPKSGTVERSSKPSNGTPAGDRTVEQALQQITIALYRAFAREVTECFSAHARGHAAQSPAAAGDILELAGQLVLDLDLAPDLAVLRDRWDRLGRLENGVIWPTPEPGQEDGVNPGDQGIREIVALATANQAFQVCIGEFERKRTDKDAASQQRTANAEVKLDAKDAANKLMGSVAGLVAGAALWPSGSATAVAAGVATALISTMTLGWANNRAKKGERGLDYTFVTKSNLQTLERDLPLVVERIRQAGLAPIFVIDELDKVQDAVNGIKNLIDRLKSLMTDFGFFCFLTDRDYYEHIERAANAVAFPTEHTYFSHRLLLQYGPRDLAHYLGHVLTIEGTRLVADRRGPGTAQSLTRLSAWILATCAVHDGRLNTIQVVRQVTDNQDAVVRSFLSLDHVRSSTEYRLPVVVQLAVEIVLRRPSIRRRTETDPAFAQWAIDALYMISTRWDENQEVDVSEEGLCTYLAVRHPTLVKYLVANGSSLADHIGKTELPLLVEAVRELAGLLADFGRLHQAVTSDPVIAEILGRVPDDSIPDAGERERLLVPLLTEEPLRSGRLLCSTTVATKYRFAFDRFGNSLVRHATSAANAAERYEAIAQRARAFLSMVDSVGLEMSRLLLAGVLPSNINENAVRASLGLANQVDDPATRAIITEFDSVTTERAIPLVAMLAFVGILVVDGERWYGAPCPAIRAWEVLLAYSPAMRDLVTILNAAGISEDERLSREQRPLRSPPGPGILFLAVARGVPFGRVTAIGWEAMYADARARLENVPERQFVGSEPRPRWNYWRGIIQAWLSGTAPDFDPIGQHAAMVETSVGLLPGSLLKADLNNMTILDWSRFAAVTFVQDMDQPWAAPIALRALGFSGRWMTRHPTSVGPDLTGEQDGPPGLLLILRSDVDSPLPSAQRPADRPIFAVTLPMEPHTLTMVTWLRQCDALDDVVNEDDHGHS